LFQVVPWYIRLWLHTLQLTLDDQVGPAQPATEATAASITGA
jgi:hypothetical protein